MSAATTAGEAIRADRYPTLAEWCSSAEFSPLEISPEPGWSRFNPSLALRGDGALRGVVRSANYRYENGRIVTGDSDGVIRSINYLVDVDEWGRARHSRLIEPPTGPGASEFPILGYEDVRLFFAGDELWGLATVRDREVSGICRMMLLRIADDGRVVSETMVVGPDPARHEKNWAPITGAFSGLGSDSFEPAVTIVYLWDPLVIATVSLHEGVFTELSRRPSGLSPRTRGGSNGVRVDGGWLFVVHESRRYPDRALRYLHRFVLLADDGMLRGATPLTSLLADGIEFASGAALVGEKLLVSFGLEDAESWVARLPVDDVMNALRPVTGGGGTE